MILDSIADIENFDPATCITPDLLALDVVLFYRALPSEHPIRDVIKLINDTGGYAVLVNFAPQSPLPQETLAKIETCLARARPMLWAMDKHAEEMWWGIANKARGADLHDTGVLQSIIDKVCTTDVSSASLPFPISLIKAGLDENRVRVAGLTLDEICSDESMTMHILENMINSFADHATPLSASTPKNFVREEDEKYCGVALPNMIDALCEGLGEAKPKRIAIVEGSLQDHGLVAPEGSKHSVDAHDAANFLKQALAVVAEHHDIEVVLIPGGEGGEQIRTLHAATYAFLEDMVTTESPETLIICDRHVIKYHMGGISESSQKDYQRRVRNADGDWWGGPSISDISSPTDDLGYPLQKLREKIGFVVLPLIDNDGCFLDWLDDLGIFKAPFDGIAEQKKLMDVSRVKRVLAIFADSAKRMVSFLARQAQPPQPETIEL